jgi:guanine nucleotide-binding protein G(q) subunit alpha
MGGCFSGPPDKGTPVNKGKEPQSPGNRKVDAEYKFLLLGSGESGKSTFHKQIRIVLGETEFLKKEEGLYVNTIYANILFTVHAAGQYFKKNNIKISDENEVTSMPLTLLEILENLQRPYSE